MKTIKNKLVIIIILFIFLVLFASLVLSECPKTRYSPNDLRSDIRAIVLSYLYSPGLDYSKQEILDLIAFYKSNKDKPLVDNCDVLGTNSGKQISAILKKTITFQRECNDGIDNDGDGKIDLNDAGCTDFLDNDETNCGDGICEGGESCISCIFDCCLPSEIRMLFMKDGGANAISFRENGDVILKGALTQGTSPAADNAKDEFIFRDSSGANVAIINLVTGNMVIKGTLSERQAALTNPPSNDFIVKDLNGKVVSYIDESGNFYLKGSLTQNGNP